MSLLLPSTVTDQKFMSMPPNQRVVEDDEEWEKYGKWMLIYPGNDLTWADKAWTDLQVLLNNGSLPLLKASTAAFKKVGLIWCYTRPGPEEARKAADAIREVVHYEYMMYHKSNRTTNEGIASRFGDRNFSQYMHTFQGHFYVKEAIQRWRFVDTDTRNESSISGRHHEASEPSEAVNIPLGLQALPSSGIVISSNRFSELVHTLHTAGQRRTSTKGYFQLKCSLQKEEDGLVEADCVWSAVRSLYVDGDFVRIKSCPETAITANIQCFVADFSDSLNVFNTCRRIFQKSRYPSLIYFYKSEVNKPELKYVFTPQGEVYEELREASRKFILNFKKELE